MVIGSFYSHAGAKYQCDMHEFISIGEGREVENGLALTLYI